MSRLRPEKYFALTHVCRNCPFRTDIQQYLSPQRKEDIATALQHGEEFVCHKTVDYSDNSDCENYQENQDKARACAGARSVAHKENIVSQMEQIATRLGFIVPIPHSTNPTYNSFKDWIAGQK